ncbi:hypothetical protein [Cellvibrio sp. UBA7671]|uniref:hypothetical protein n=1 Tax=Cellvibrio sp. UBA7671 TaxID=1946312 RepID=UPI002F352183
MSSQQHIFTRVGGTRFVATMACGLASFILLRLGDLNGDQFVELGEWTLGAFIAGNATQNAASYFGNRKSNQPEPYEASDDSKRQY